MSEFRAVLFDLDGTLAHTVPSLTLALNDTLRHRGLAPLSEAEVARLVGRGQRFLLEAALRLRGAFPGAAELDGLCADFSRRATARGHAEVSFFPGALAAIRRLRGSGLLTALVTNKARSMTRGFLREKGVAGLFDALICGDDPGLRPKPAPDLPLAALRALGVAADRAALIGDSRNDALAARAAGLTAALVSGGYNEGEPIAEWAAAEGFAPVFDSLPEAVDWILSR